MNPNPLPDFQQYLENWLEDFDVLRQNDLLEEDRFTTFARDRGIDVWGASKGDVGIFHAHGWLESDGIGYREQPAFHPFRIFTLRDVLKMYCSNEKSSASLDCDRNQWIMEGTITSLPNGLSMNNQTKQRINITNLAILLEPIYWPNITGIVTFRNLIDETDYALRADQYRQKALELIQSLNIDEWQEAHKQLRIAAAQTDRNSELYLLLRLAKWDKRKRLTGHISGALWLRHMAEVIRLAFEEAHSVQWLEEDQGLGHWPAGARARTYGSERPLDDEVRSKPYLAFEYGLHTGSAVRWYVEGETEYHAILFMFPEPTRHQIELINLKGNLATDKDNIALKLKDHLEQDKAQKRFSMITFDKDVAVNVKKIKRQIEQGNVVGYIAAHAPDFEFANFSLDELVEIAAKLDEAQGASGDAVRKANWEGIAKASDFEKKYLAVSEQKPQSLKGEEWGVALAQYMVAQPIRVDNGQERLFWGAVRAAYNASGASYDFHQEYIGFNPDTLEQIELKKIE